MTPTPCYFCGNLPSLYACGDARLLDCSCRPHEIEPSDSYEEAVEKWNAVNQETEGVEAA